MEEVDCVNILYPHLVIHSSVRSFVHSFTNAKRGWGEGVATILLSGEQDDDDVRLMMIIIIIPVGKRAYRTLIAIRPSVRPTSQPASDSFAYPTILPR